MRQETSSKINFLVLECWQNKDTEDSEDTGRGGHREDTGRGRQRTRDGEDTGWGRQRTVRTWGKLVAAH